jgi:exodeoxyribonuclease VII small subunit
MAIKKTESQPESSVAGQSFEKAMERLEAIAREMEDKKLGLEEMISRFEEGQSLLKFCSNKLNEVEKKIEVLVRKGDRVVSEDLDADGEPEESGEETKKRTGSADLPF